MIINLSPIRDDNDLVVAVHGDILTLNGEDFDFGPLEEGDSLTTGAVASPLVVGEVTRLDGEIVVTILLPHGQYAQDAARFPAPVHVLEDGAVALPDRGHNPPVESAENPSLPEDTEDSPPADETPAEPPAWTPESPFSDPSAASPDSASQTEEPSHE